MPKKPGYVKVAYILALFFIIVHVIFISAVAYWQLVDPYNLDFKVWLKAPLHLVLFDSVGLAAAVAIALWLVQLVCLFLYISWINTQGKRIYYLSLALVVLGIWTYFLIPALLLLCLMLPHSSLRHFGLQSFEDIF